MHVIVFANNLKSSVCSYICHKSYMWNITHVVVPETIRIFEFSMELLISETTFKNISKL